MNNDRLRKFIADNVPRRSELNSAILEFAAQDHGLVVRRESQRVIYVEFPTVSSTPMPFVGLQGPDASSVARWLCRHPNGLQALSSYHGLGHLHFRGQPEPTGDHLRVFVATGRVVSATKLVPAHVVGNGTDTVAKLIDRKNAELREHPILCDRPIPTKASELHRLAADGRSLAHVPPDGETVVLQAAPTDGVDIVDITDSVDAEVTKLAVSVVAMLPRLPQAEVEIHQPAEGDPVAIGVHYQPTPWACFPTLGQPRDITAAVIDHYRTAPGWLAAQQTETV